MTSTTQDPVTPGPRVGRITATMKLLYPMPVLDPDVLKDMRMTIAGQHHVESLAINAALLADTFCAVLRANEAWVQTSWRCSTGMCFAGWGLTLAGGAWASASTDATRDYVAEVVLDNEDDLIDELTSSGDITQWDSESAAEEEIRATFTAPVADVMTLLFGLDVSTAEELYSANNSLLVLNSKTQDLIVAHLKAREVYDIVARRLERPSWRMLMAKAES